MNRAERRYLAERAKKRVRGYYGGYAVEMPDHIGMIARTRALCSCRFCGNPRKYRNELTPQELRQNEADKVTP